jgi:tRNA pseudouridine synthase 10
MDILEICDIVLKQGEVCDHCLGRQVSLKYLGVPCELIGSALRKAKNDKDIEKNLKRKTKPKVKQTKNCFICKGIFLELKSWDKKIKDMVKKEEFHNFLVGCKIPKEIETAEEKLWEKIGPEFCEPLKREINRIVGNTIKKVVDKKVEYTFQDVVFILDFNKDTIEVQRNALFIYGRYKKFVHIPQTKWPCRSCRGQGCEKCNFTGKQYQETVEELIAAKVLEATSGIASAFHGKGREDISARMLGTGRPFVLEMVEPKKRFLDLKKLQSEINEYAKGKVEVSDLRFSNMLEVRLLKTEMPPKTYECLIECEKPITKEDVEKIEKEFTNTEISQKTPLRVLHRRADKIRKRKIIYAKCTLISEKQFHATIKSQAGTYIKELISGDERRTKPSFSSILNSPCVCKKLDVVEVS